ncbi:MAG: hypothetical protein BGO05_09840 [Rhizobiales bacterium 63-7]|nr:hypothetical protein [Hyphomicrobiales bacterium]OJU71376.1 MAG: hypothetical protein BGO05_09840 [Rhizobiales bacterium 63-7]
MQTSDEPWRSDQFYWYDRLVSEAKEWAENLLFGFGVDSENRAQHLVALMQAFVLTSEQQWAIFQDTWTMCDSVPADVLDELADTLDFSTMGHEHLTGEDFEFFQALPDVVEVYRGASPDRRKGWAWTTDIATAESFARGHRRIKVRNGTVYRGLVSKAEIWTVFTDRNEAEIFTPPWTVRHLRVHSRLTKTLRDVSEP